MEEIAAAAKVSKPVVYEHFGGKEGLYAVVVDREVQQLLAIVTRELTADAHPRVLLEGAALGLLDYIETSTDGFRILVRDSPVAQSTGTFSSLLGDTATQVEHVLVDAFAARGFDRKTAPMYAQMLVGHGGHDRAVVARAPPAQEGRGGRPPGQPGLERAVGPGGQAPAGPGGATLGCRPWRPPHGRRTRGGRRHRTLQHRSPGQDEVDRITAAWARVRPDLDVAPLEVLSRVTRLAHHLDRARASTFEAHGLERWEFDVLAALRRSGPPHRLTPSQLLPADPGHQRDHDHPDRPARRPGPGTPPGRPRRPPAGRGGATDDGLRLVDAAMASLLEREASFLAGMPRRDRDRLADLLRALVRPFERRRDPPPR